MIQQFNGWVRRYWVFAAVLLLLTLAFAVSAPAWAAPPSSVKYQTVPKPTPTPEDNPVATATPRPDDDDDDDGGDGGGGGTGGTAPVDNDVPVFLIAPEKGDDALTASVSVATLNVREGPGTEFPVIGSLSSGDVVNVLRRNEGNSWWYICCVPGTSDAGWTSALLLEPDFDRATSADVIPIFGAVIAPEAEETSGGVSEETAPVAATAEIPLTLGMSVSPTYLRQGQTGKIVLEVANPNLEEALNVELSDQLPPELELLDVSVDGQGRVSEQTSDEGTTLVLVRWESIPAGGSVFATLSVKIAENLEDGAVFDNLAAVRGANAAYASSAVTIGMPPVLLPDFK